MTRSALLAAAVACLGFVLSGTMPPAARSGTNPGNCPVDPSLPDPLHIQMETVLGVIVVELWPDVAPCTVENFLEYVDSGRYDGTFVHRTVDDFVIQGGGYRYQNGVFVEVQRDPAVVNEPGESNVRGTIAMARIGGQVNSATSEWFINLKDNLSLDTTDQGFTVFGEVFAGMDVVDAIGELPRVDGRELLETSLRRTFSELPLEGGPPDDQPGGYGCYDPTLEPRIGFDGWLRALMDEDGLVTEVNPETGGAITLSTTCDGTNATGPPSVPCTDSREVAWLRFDGWWVDPTPMTCDAIAEFEEADEQRRAYLEPLVAERLVTMTVPEPGGALAHFAATGAIAALALLRRRRRRPRR